MKKISIVVALLLVAALAAVPASAQNFSDVEADHWAYEAVNELVATGIVEGYPDGTFGGDENMTRYEISMVLTRLMDRLEDERDELADDLEPEEGLTSEQALEVDAIVESMMEENMPEEEVSSEDVEEVTSAIEKLEEEYSLEMELISGFVQDNIEGISDVNDDVADLEEDQDNVYIDGEYNVSFKDVIYDDKDGTWDNGPIADPFAEADLYNDDDEWDSDLLFGGDVYFSDPEVDAGDYDNDVIENDEFVNTLDMDFNVNTDVLDADLETSAALNYHDSSEEDEDFLTFEDLSGDVEGNGFKASIKKEINPGLAPFLYNTDTNDGAVVEVGDTSYVLSAEEADIDIDDILDKYDIDDDEDLSDDEADELNEEAFFDEDVSAGDDAGELEDEDLNDAADSNYHVNAGIKHPVDIIGQSLNLYYGTHKHDAADPEDDTPVFDATVDSESNEVLGADTELGLAGFTASPAFAIQNPREEESETYFDLNVDGDVGPIATEFNYKDIEDFEGVVGDFDEAKGYDVSGDTTLIDLVDVGVTYEDYSELGGDYDRPRFGTTAEITEDREAGLLGIDLWTDFEYASFSDPAESAETDSDEGTLMTWNGTARKYLMDENLELKGEMKYANIDEGYGAIDGDVDATVDGEGELDNILSAEYGKGMLTAGAEMHMLQEDTNKTVLYADVAPDALNVFTWGVSPHAGVKTAMYADDSDTETNLEAGVEATKDINDYSSFAASYDWADKYYDVEHSGTLQKWGALVDYDLSDDVTADLKYKKADFIERGLDDEDDDDAGYESEALTAGVTVSF